MAASSFVRALIRWWFLRLTTFDQRMLLIWIWDDVMLLNVRLANSRSSWVVWRVSPIFWWGGLSRWAAVLSLSNECLNVKFSNLLLRLIRSGKRSIGSINDFNKSTGDNDAGSTSSWPAGIFLVYLVKVFIAATAATPTHNFLKKNRRLLVFADLTHLKYLGTLNMNS